MTDFYAFDRTKTPQRNLIMWVRILTLMGMALSIYSIHVEIEKARLGDAYKPACDLTEEIKCSKVNS